MTLIISSSFSLSFLSDDNDPWHIIEKDVLVSAIYFIQCAGPGGGGLFKGGILWSVLLQPYRNVFIIN